jgi:acetyl esterase/lipase
MPRHTSGGSLRGRLLNTGVIAAAVWIGASFAAAAQPDAIRYSHQSDVIYGRKHGLALTMEVFSPEKSAGLGVVWVVSSGGTSSREQALTESFEKRIGPLLDRGYVVFAVVHGNAPAFQVQDYVSDARRAVRFVRHQAKRFGIDGGRIGIAGSSSGGLIALMAAMDARDGNQASVDVVERESTRVQAAGAFFPPTDLLNYGEASLSIVDLMRKRGGPVDPSFHFYAADEKTAVRTLIADPEVIGRHLREASPVTYVSPDDPPTILIHGDQDRAVPLQQSQQLADRLSAAKVAVRLVTRSGKSHAWAGWEADSALIAAWFDTHLKPAH